jgi:uncharacterized protein YukE
VISLDDVYEQMRLFERALVEFNQEIHASTAALEESHQEVYALWRDEAAQRYLQTYEPLAKSLEDYLRGSAPRFERFLENKLGHLERYLHGG